VLVGTRASLYRIERGSDAAIAAPIKIALPMAQPLVDGFADDGSGGQWIATHHGLLHLGRDGGVSVVEARAGMSHALPGNVLLDAHRDREGGLWLGLLGGGLAHLKPTWRNFSLLRDADPAYA